MAPNNNEFHVFGLILIPILIPILILILNLNLILMKKTKKNQCETGLPFGGSWRAPRVVPEALRARGLGKGRVRVSSQSLIDLKSSRRIYTPRG